MNADTLHPDRASLSMRRDGAQLVLEPRGDWLVDTIARLEPSLHQLERESGFSVLTIDVSGIGRIDTAGAYLLGRPLKHAGAADAAIKFAGEHPTAERLITEMRARQIDGGPEPDIDRSLAGVMARIGRAADSIWRETYDSFAFLGRTTTTGAAVALRPARWRVTSMVYLMETVGVNALPIIAVLSFFIGAVVAYMGANLLDFIGFSVFTVELVGIAVLREFAVLITAILLAGRSASAFTAAIGSMKMQQEVDAMKVMGLDPYEVLVLPRVFACAIMAPLLTLAAMLSGIFGGMLVAWASLGISPTFFIVRLQDTVPIDHLWVGLSKAPVFGLVIAIIGCRHGLKVGGDVESLGSSVTTAVVQAIFAVILIDALFAMLYLEMGI
ncbi:MlaE family lipid ABC transporter permease subunit [Alkalicaulis satelles]|uniref:MlaE family lipid ABC transporter permease subunit n=1 Tax=Alkalicaulis satelles TaxID=2609175 RepID=A0A5M6ZB76_9PROT|nr:ABC transporter permease [Alkalicaulis satelles]KAA5801027.1 MlaE family lipid ABC transporter permease subunit [Alkalicaulis satelles]